MGGDLIKDQVSKEFWSKVLTGDKVDYTALRFSNPLENQVLKVYKCELDSFKNIATEIAKSPIAQSVFSIATIQALFYRYTSHQNICLLSSSFKLKEEIVSPKLVLIGSDISKGFTFRELLQQSKTTILNSTKHQDFDLVTLSNDLDEKLPEVAVVYEGVNKKDVIPSSCDLIFQFSNAGVLEIAYNPSLFGSGFVENLCNHVNAIWASVKEDLDVKIEDILLFDDQKMYADQQELNVGYPESDTIVSIFEKRAAQYPNSVALIFEGNPFTYEQLNQKANQLAHALRDRGVDRNDLVGVLQDRSFDMIVSLLGIIKAGGAYVPIDPDYPKERIDYTLSDSKVQLLITKEDLVDQVDSPVELIFTDNSDLSTFSKENPAQVNDPQDLAYIIYTSGSTGKPKGVMVEHRNVVRLFFTDQPLFEFSSSDVWTLFHSYCFDFSVWEMYGALLYGGQLVILSKEEAQSPALFLELMESSGVTVLNQTPSAFYNLIHQELTISTDADLGLRYVVFGGEALSPGKLKEWNKKYPSTKLINMYGITETTVHVTYKEIGKTEIDNNVSNIGVAIPTLQLYVLDENKRLLSDGIPGEMYVAGDGVARGYLNREELTGERFIVSPYDSSQRWYKSGDLARKLPNGDFEYLGRNDAQVKIRGFRIELGEVENHLTKHSAIKECVVLAMTLLDDEPQLVAYLIGEDLPDSKALISFLNEQVPKHMVPSYFVEIDQIPLTSNGKIDKKALPDPIENSLGVRQKYIAPESELQRALVKVWEDVLKNPKIGIDDDFFLLGGDSLKVIKVVIDVKQQAEIDLSAHLVFKYPTIRELSIALEEPNNVQFSIQDQLELGYSEIEEFKARIASVEQNLEVLPKQYDDLYPLSSIEAGMIYSSILRPEEPVYYDQFVYALDIPNVEVFEHALQLLVRKHDILRTRFYLHALSEPTKVVVQLGDLPVEIKDLSKLSKVEQQGQINAYMSADTQKRYSFDGDILWYITAFKTDDTTYQIIWSVHHAILDGWSVNAFSTELVNLCANPALNELNGLEDLKHSYKDFCALNLAKKANLDNQEYWKQLLAGYTRNKLPFNISGKKLNQELGMIYATRFEGAQFIQSLDEVVKVNRVAAKALYLSAYLYLMHLITSEKDVVTGVVSHHRPEIEDGEKILGCFLNTIPIRVDFAQVKTYADLLSEVQNYLVEVKQHEIDLVEISTLVDSQASAENPIFDCIFNFTDFHVRNEAKLSEQLSTAEFRLTDEVERTQANQMTNTLFDFEVDKTGGRLRVQVKYAKAFFHDGDVEYAIQLYLNILQQFVENLQNEFNTNLILEEDDREKILYGFNNTIVDYPKEKSMHQLFEEQVQITPNAIALTQDGKSLTYQALETKANQVANYLIDLGVENAENIGVITDRGFDMIIAMYGILKAGGAYVPIDPTYPIDRQKYILENSNASKILVDHDYQVISDMKEKVQGIRLDSESIKISSSESPNLIKNSQDLAYTIYTSGSTGRPKGVMIEHHSAVNLINWVNKKFDVGQGDRLLFITSMCFDLSVYDIFGTLACGATVVIAKKDQVEDPERLMSLMIKEKITFWDSVPTTMNYLVDMIETSETDYQQTDLRLVFMSGDWIPVTLSNRIKKYFPNAQNISLGGATEGTVWSNYYPIETVEEDQISIPYGVPIDNNFFYILDDFGNPVPKGVAGELHIGGVGVARGYANDEQKTSAQFVKDPYSRLPDAMMYKTGDLGRLMPDGNMEFLGRKDFQVKIRGFRVELGEIENQLQLIPQVHRAIVLAKGDNNHSKFLCAYVVESESISNDEIKRLIGEHLPDYMIPSVIIRIDQVPITANGKIDRKALPEPEELQENAVNYEAPEEGLEKELEQLWVKVLGKINQADFKIGRNDNVFELGAHSLHAGAFVSLVQKNLELPINLRELFGNPTIKGLAKLLSGKNTSRYDQIKKISKQEHYPLSFAQKQLWLADQVQGGSTTYILSGKNVLNGDLDVEAFKQAFNEIIKRHEALRISFLELEGEPFQKINEAVPFELSVVDLSSRTNAEELLIEHLDANARTPFDLSTPPLLRASLVVLPEQRNVLMYAMHHIISDGWSMGLMISEAVELYNNYSSGKSELDYSPTEFQFMDFVAWENEQLSDKTIGELKVFWDKHFDGGIRSLDLPYDKMRSGMALEQPGKTLPFWIEDELVNGLYDLAKSQKVTLNVLLMSIYTLFLSKISSSEEVTIRSITSGRNKPELEKLVGYFVRVLGIKNYPSGNKSFATYLDEVKNRYLDVLDHNMYPFEKILEQYSAAELGTTGNLINASFALQNLNTVEQLQQSEKLEGVQSKGINHEAGVARNDLLLTVKETNGGLTFLMNYNTDLFHESKVNLMADWFKNLLKEVVAQPYQELSDFKLSTGQEDSLYSHLGVSKSDYSELLPLTTIQRDLYLDTILNPEDAAHSLAFYVELNRDLNVEVWQQAVQKVIALSPSLRTKIVVRDNDIYQGFKTDTSLEHKLIQVDGLAINEIEKLIEAEAKVPYNFDSTELLRHVLIKNSDQQYFSLLCAHHVIFDGWSFKLFFEKATEIYQSLMENREVDYTTDNVFSSYVNWHNNHFDSHETEIYWTNKLAEVEPLHVYHQGHLLNSEEDNLISRQTYLTESQISAIESYCSSNKISVSLYFKSLFALLIKIHTRTETDFTIRELLGGRTKDQLQGMGCYYHSIPVCFAASCWDNSDSVLDYFNYVKSQKKELGERQNVSFLLQNKIIGKEEISFYYNYQTYFKLNLLGEDVPLKSINTYSENQVQLLVRETFDGLKLILDFDQRYFHDYDLIDRLLNVSDQITAGVTSIKALKLVDSEQLSLVAHSNLKEITYPNVQIHEIFEQQVLAFPNQIAVKFDDISLTYSELNSKANQFAHYIRSKRTVQPDDLIGLFTDRSEQMIVGILAILKSGAGYVPIDPNYPKDRIHHFITDSNVDLILTNQADHPALEGVTVELMDLSENLDRVNDLPNTNLTSISSPESIAYVIYTSGSTGVPKGTLVEHGNVVSLLSNSGFGKQGYEFHFDENDTWTLFHSFCFDFSIWEIFGALFKGGKVVIVPKEIASSPTEFRKLLIRENVTVLNQIPSLFVNLIEEELAHEASELNLNYVIFGGEALQPATLNRWYQKYPDTRLINMYGITETTVHVTYKEITEEEIKIGKSNIGKVIPSLEAYLMDSDLNVLPVGIPGEICISGYGVSRGYLNRDELTAQRFVENPLNPSSRLYRSGDLGRLLPNGEIEYLGRIDQQVKVRGFRIELGEIESRLLNHPKVQNAIVTTKVLVNNEQELVAYVQSQDDIETLDLRAFMLELLPDYMVPSHFVVLAQFPTTASGKVNRRALPEVDLSRSGDNQYVPPRNNIELTVQSIWKDVLAKPQISINDNFFEIGGHSLKATRVASAVHKHLNVEIPIRSIFIAPTIRELAELIESKGQGDHFDVKPIEKRDHYPISAAQRRMYILNQLQPLDTTYNMPVVMNLVGALDVNKLQNAFDQLLDRHDSLRTSFKIVEGKPVQVIIEGINVEIENYDSTKEDARRIVKDFIRPFDLSSASLFRVGLIKLGEEEFVLMTDMHHIISDGVSMQILVQEFLDLYEGKELEPVKLTYKDYANWQNEWSKSDKMQKQESFWMDQFSGEIPVLNLHPDYSRPPVQTFDGAQIYDSFSESESLALKEIVKQSGSTLYILLLAIYNVTLAKYSNQEDIVVGSPIAGRSHSDLEHIIGMFVNTIALRNYPNKDLTFSNFLNQVRENTLEVYDNQTYQFEDIVEKLDVVRDLSRNPLFDTMFIFQNLRDQEKKPRSIKGLEISRFGTDVTTSKFDLTLEAWENADQLSFSLTYATKLFKSESIERFAEHFKQVAREIIQNPDLKLASVQLLSDNEKKLVLEDFNNTYLEYDHSLNVLGLFKKQVKNNPEKIALHFEDQQITYQNLDEKSNGLANVLLDEGVTKATILPIMVDRSVDMVVALLAILKAGAAYVPVDPKYPADRIKYMISNSDAQFILCSEAYAGNLEEVDVKTIVLEQLIEKADKSTNEISNLEIEASQLAYVIYTSGSTGLPKGVSITHGNLTSLLHWALDEFSSLKADTLFAATSYSFDLSIYELFYGLVSGKKIRLLQDGTEIPKYLSSETKILLNTVPSVVLQLVESQCDLSNVVGINMAGEPIPLKIKEQLDLDNIVVRNLYGPSEDTTYSTHYLIKDVDARQVVGKPIANTKAFVLDSDQNLLGIGIPGELYLSGESVTQGYLNNDQLTAERYVTYNHISDERMYKTGDLVRWLESGDLEYLGRIDQQVKIRGFRIELEEIQNQLEALNNIDQAVVIVSENGSRDKQLGAYFTSSKSSVEIGEIRSLLGNKLPSYMIPMFFMQLGEIPRTPNGKIDKKALPKGSFETLSKLVVEPETKLQATIAEIWSEVLGVEKVGIEDNFYELGGHSLMAMQVVLRISSQTSLDVQLSDLFHAKTVKELAERLENKGNDSVSVELTTIDKADYYDVSHAQKRLWFLAQLNEANNVAYNMPAAFILTGDLDTEAFKKAFGSLVERHEILRTVFIQVDGQPKQQVNDFKGFEINELDLTGSNDPQEEAKKMASSNAQTPFDMEKGPLMRVTLAKLEDSKYLFLFAMHHIISDGWSLDLLIKEVITFYNYHTGVTSKIPADLSLHYKDFAAWHNALLEQDEQKVHEAYWKEKMSGSLQTLKLPYDKLKDKNTGMQGGKLSFQLDENITSKIREIARLNSTTPYNVVLGSLYILLYKLTSQNDLIIGSPVAGRIDEKLENQIGYYLNTLALRTVIDSNDSFESLLNNTIATVLEAQDHQIYPYDKLVSDLKIKNPHLSNGLFNVGFTWGVEQVNTESSKETIASDLTMQRFGDRQDIAKSDLWFYGSDYGKSIGLFVVYNTGLFEGQKMQMHMDLFKTIINKVLEDPKAIVSEVIKTEQNKPKRKSKRQRGGFDFD